ncbi:Bcr/CflA family efflux MFS transporter [Limnohabitans sp. Rim28]|uniref:Bcr/CflA family efflux MFS transporter n=1 Tax=Limnohabitans sp. Rim28 TaxID=1100720 RepID=UPI00031DF48E|nr:Bcr/CflA family efflux MFS transporter [Limnohabitans sp. Rim28]PVE07355.1 Bcr/CflA family drug resistance efflux transporter [Limnohabitans sp. Rim28]
MSAAPGTPGPGAHSPWLIANVLAQISFGLLAMTLCLPSMQEWGAIFDTRQADVQLTFSGYVVAYGALQLVYGPLSDRHGRKPILMIGLVVAGLASVMAALATDIATLTAARVLQGAGSAASMVVGRSMVQDLFTGPLRTRVMAYIGMALGLCPPLATLIGGQMHVRFGWQTNFVLLAILAGLLLVAAWLGLPQVTRPAPAQGHWLRAMLHAYARLLREPRFLLYVAILAATTATFYAFLAGAPIVLKGYGIGPDGIGWFIMAVPVSYILGNFMTSRLIAQAGELRVMAWGQVLTVTGLLIMLALGLGGVQTALAVALPLILLGLGHGLINPPALAGTVGVMPALAGSAAAVAGLMQQLTGATGGYLVGLVPHEGAVNLGWMMLSFALIATAAQWGLHRSKRL